MEWAKCFASDVWTRGSLTIHDATNKERAKNAAYAMLGFLVALKARQKLSNGMVLVPIEPTQKMLDAFRRCHEWLKTDEGMLYAGRANFEGALGKPYWKAMLSAYDGERKP
jgi:hypothetical protein